jgi:hypothetical protein
LRSFDEGKLVDLFADFTLQSTHLLGWSERSILTSLRSLRPAYWHDCMVCPACGFRKTRVRGSGPPEEESRTSGLTQIALRLLPKTKMPEWLVGIYSARR